MLSKHNKKRQYQKVWYDKTSKPLCPLSEGQVVWMQTQRGHDRLATVKRICKEPRSYIVESGGHDYRRNRRHLLPVLEAPPPPAHQLDNGDQAAVTPLTGEPSQDGAPISPVRARDVISDDEVVQGPAPTLQQPARDLYVPLV